MKIFKASDIRYVKVVSYGGQVGYITLEELKAYIKS